MSDFAQLRAQAAAARAGSVGATAGGTTSLPDGQAVRSGLRFPGEVRAKKVNREGMDWYELEGYASVYERGYEMWDFFGPYTEVVSAGAASKSLAADPDVVYRFNHGGTPMARTTNKRLELWEDTTGLGDRAWVNPKRADVAQLVTAIEDRDVSEQSFMFTIRAGTWSPDYMEYRIQEVDLNRGDVGPVTYGANPNTSVAARSGEILGSLAALPPLAARAALDILAARADLAATIPAPAPSRGAGDLALLKLRLDLER